MDTSIRPIPLAVAVLLSQVGDHVAYHFFLINYIRAAVFIEEFFADIILWDHMTVKK